MEAGRVVAMTADEMSARCAKAGMTRMQVLWDIAGIFKIPKRAGLAIPKHVRVYKREDRKTCDRGPAGLCIGIAHKAASKWARFVLVEIGDEL